jgi:transcriptional regulator with XRE-family HTH domain
LNSIELRTYCATRGRGSGGDDCASGRPGTGSGHEGRISRSYQPVVDRPVAGRYPEAVQSSVGANIRRLRERAGLTQVALADRLDVTQPSVWKWEHDRSGLPEAATLFKLAKALDCTVEDILAGIDREYEAAKRERLGLETQDPDGRPVDLVVVTEGDAAPSAESRRGPSAGASVPRPRDLRDPLAYAVRVRGDSMLPVFRPGMIVIVSPRLPVEMGDEAYVHLRTEERLLRRVRKTAGGYLLESTNPAYPARVIRQRDLAAMHPVVYTRRRLPGRQTAGR